MTLITTTKLDINLIETYHRPVPATQSQVRVAFPLPVQRRVFFWHRTSCEMTALRSSVLRKLFTCPCARLMLCDSEHFTTSSAIIFITRLLRHLYLGGAAAAKAFGESPGRTPWT